MLKKISNDDQSVNRDASFYEKFENDVFYRHLKSVGPKPLQVPFGSLKVPISTPKVSDGTLGCQLHFRVWVRFGLLFQVFLSQASHLDMFSIRILRFLSLFQIIQVFSATIILQIYSKINFDKVQIIHNFIVIQLSPLFPRKKSNFRH